MLNAFLRIFMAKTEEISSQAYKYTFLDKT